MKKFSGQLYHVGVNLFLIPGAAITNQSQLTFQQEIRAVGLDFSTFNVNPQNNAINVIRSEPSSPLQITVAMAQPPVSQLTIIAPMPKTGIDMFYDEAEAVVKAYQTVWSAPAWQIIRCDATVRELHETDSDHAFKELWEKRLKQTPADLKAFDKPLIGGGLRFVLGPKPEDKQPIQIEVKVESFLSNARKMFIETQFIWLQPSEPAPEINVRERLVELKNYVENNVLGFMEGGTNGN